MKSNVFENRFLKYFHISLQTKQVNELIINTVETERLRFFLEKFVLQHIPVLFVGPTGTGKSAITNNFLLQLPKDKYIINNINFSARTTSNQTQDIIFSKLERWDHTTRCICFSLSSSIQ